MKWMLIIMATGYGGSPVVSTQLFATETYCNAARAELAKRQMSGWFSKEPKYECVELKL